METSETDVVVESQNNDTEVTPNDVPQTEAPAKETESPEARVARLKRELARAQRKAGIAEEEAEDAKFQPKNKSFELGYEHKAFLNANGIKGQDEYSLVKEYAQNTGKEIEDIIETKFFQSELKELRALRDSRMASDAASGSKRGQQSARDTVDYWLAKGDEALPPSYQTQLRRDVINARIKKYDNQSPFKND